MNYLQDTVSTESFADFIRDSETEMDLQSGSQSRQRGQAFVPQYEPVIGYKLLSGRELGLGQGNSLRSSQLI